jgi:hypothetical protein
VIIGLESASQILSFPFESVLLGIKNFFAKTTGKSQLVTSKFSTFISIGLDVLGMSEKTNYFELQQLLIGL